MGKQYLTEYAEGIFQMKNAVDVSRKENASIYHARFSGVTIQIKAFRTINSDVINYF